jgi:hypothetical protein
MPVCWENRKEHVKEIFKRKSEIRNVEESGM